MIAKLFIFCALRRNSIMLLLQISLSIFLMIAPCAVGLPLPVEVDVTIGESIHQKPEAGSSLREVCVTVDWWPNNTCDHRMCTWNKASVLSLDLDSPKLQKAVQELGGVVLRVRGEAANSMIYEDKSSACPDQSSSQSNTWHNCLSMQRWDELVNFCAKTGCRIVFGLSMLYGRKEDDDEPWNSSNAYNFLNYIAQQNQVQYVMGFEVGSRLNSLHPEVSPERLANDVVALSQKLSSIFSGRTIPKLLIPDYVGWDNIRMRRFLDIAKDHLYAVTWQSYPLGTGHENPLVESFILNPIFLAMHYIEAEQIVQQVATLGGQNRSLQVWLGESGGASDFGKNGTSNAFINSFWYLNEMASLAARQYSQFCRQTLVGGNYELIDHVTHDPNPDFFALLLYTRFIGPQVLELTAQERHTIWSRVSVYAHRRGTQQTFLLLNFYPDRPAYFHIPNLYAKNAQIFHITAGAACLAKHAQGHHNAHLHCRQVAMNGIDLTIDNFNSIQGLPIELNNSTNTVVLAPASYAMIDIPPRHIQVAVGAI